MHFQVMAAHLAAPARVPLPRLQASGEEPPTLDELLKALGNLPLDDEEEDMWGQVKRCWCKWNRDAVVIHRV